MTDIVKKVDLGFKSQSQTLAHKVRINQDHIKVNPFPQSMRKHFNTLGPYTLRTHSLFDQAFGRPKLLIFKK